MLIYVERWPQWTASVRRTEVADGGPLRLNSRARLWLRGSVYGTNWHVTEFEPERSFTWESRVFPGVNSVAEHHITPDGDGSWLVLRITFDGPLSLAFSPMLAPVSRQNLALEANGLKRESEKRVVTGAAE